jgi:hypothetical protein
MEIMSTSPVLDPLWQSRADLIRTTSEIWPEAQERRQRPRSNVHWTVYIFGGDETRPLESRTKNLSSNGFYCFLPEPLSTGQRLCCQIMVPSDSINRNQETISLKCTIRVLRVEPVETGVFGMACLIEDYTVLRAKGMRAV